MDFLNFITKPPNFYEWNKFKSRISDNALLYSLPLFAIGLPLQAAGSILQIPSIGKNPEAFTAGCWGYAGTEQVYNGENNSGIGITDTGYIMHSISGLSEWSAEIEINGFVHSYSIADRGYNFFNSFDTNMECWYHIGDSRLVIMLQRGKSDIQLLTSFYNCSVGPDGDRIYLNDIDKQWLNTGTHIFEFGLKNGTLYFYIDGDIICSQTYYPNDKPIENINCGTYQQDSYGNWRSPGTKISKFNIYDRFIFDIP